MPEEQRIRGQQFPFSDTVTVGYMEMASRHGRSSCRCANLSHHGSLAAVQPEIGSIANKMGRCGCRKMPGVQKSREIFVKIIKIRKENCLLSRIIYNRFILKACYKCRMKDAKMPERDPDT